MDMRPNFGASQHFTSMLITVLKSKLHEVTVTEANKEYEGSITIGRDLMVAAGLVNNEQVFVHGKDNPSRIMTYVIPGEPGQIKLNGGAAQFFEPGDKIHVLAFVQIHSGRAFVSKIIHTHKNVAI